MSNKNEHISHLIPDYLDGYLDEQAQTEVEEHLSECAKCGRDLEEFRTLFKALDKDVVVPTEQLKGRFEQALEVEKRSTGRVVPLQESRKSWASDLLKIAASVALLIAAFQTGRILEMEKSNQDVAAILEESLQIKQTAMLSLMENQSASKRIQGVSYIEEFPKPDEAIINALANRLLLDENDIVRLNAFEALSKFINSASVKSVFIQALEKEKNPSIQLGIIQVLTKIQEEGAVAPMQKLLEREDTQPFIKSEIELALPKII